MKLKKFLALTLVTAFVALTPGIPCYAAIGQAFGKTTAAPKSVTAAMPVTTLGTNFIQTGNLTTTLSLPPSDIGFNAAAAATPQAAAAGPASLPQLLQEKQALAPPAAQIAAMPQARARASGFSLMDRILGTKAAVLSDAEPVLAAGAGLSGGSALAPASSGNGAAITPPPPSGSGPTSNRPNGSKVGGLLATIARVGAAAAAVIGVQVGAVALFPAVFGIVPAAAVWALSSGVVFFPAAVYARHGLSSRDSPRLGKVKGLLDFSMGAYLGALAATTAGFFPGVSPLVGAAALNVIGLAPLLGLIALPVMLTVAFFRGQLIRSAESGEPFKIPGAMQKIRFGMLNWVMLGVVFSLTTGFGAVYTTWAFLAWNIMPNKPAGWDKDAPPIIKIAGRIASFDTLYIGLLAFCAATGFSTPLTFLVIAFAPERAALWTEKLLGRFLRKSAPSPSTRVAPLAAPSEEPSRAPRFHHWLKTFSMLSAMASLGVAMGFFVFGMTSLLKNLAVAAAFAAIPFFFSNWLVKKAMQAKPTDAAQDPEFFAIMSELREKINAGRAAKGKKPIPMPEMVNIPMDVPNAFATGRSPFHATVGVTDGIKEMLLNAENLRASLIQIMEAADPNSRSFEIYRAAIAGSLPGLAPEAATGEIAAALKQADPADLKKLGARLLRGVLGHEFSHVMDRHMLTGTLAAAVSSGVAFAAYAVLWAVGHANAKNLKSKIFGGKKGGVTIAPEPISTGILIKIFLVWASPTVFQLAQMAGSRNNEAQADEDGAYLTEDPAALALALGMLMNWRPRNGFFLELPNMPRWASVAHLFTVNPLLQMEQAGALPKSRTVMRGDDFIFNLFITHPDTTWRIETLHKIWEWLKKGK